MKGSYYILDGEKKLLVEPSIHKWAEWFETADRTVCRTKINKVVFVSTVFLGMDHNFFDEGDPLLFETAVFAVEKGKTSEVDIVERYSTWDEAQEGHQRIVEKLIEQQKSREVSPD